MNRLPRLFLAVTLALMLPPAFGEEQRLPFDIPPQPLAEALESLTAQAKIQMFYSAETVQGKITSGLTGSYTVPEALGKLLQGTGLRYTFTAANAVAVKPADEETQPDGHNTGGKTRKTDEPTALPEMTVTAKGWDETSYSVPNASTATKTDTPIFDTPVSIQVVPQQVLRDQQAIRLKDALKNVSGVVDDTLLGGYREFFNIRGFSTERRQYRDGFLNEETTFSLANAERIEVLKGPASVLYGRLEPGGLINIVTKRPQSAPYYSLQQQFGSFDT